MSKAKSCEGCSLRASTHDGWCHLFEQPQSAACQHYDALLVLPAKPSKAPHVCANGMRLEDFPLWPDGVPEVCGGV